jgi:hypothetical protein
MQMPDAYTITITFTNNSTETYTLPKQGDISTLSKRFDEFRQYNEMVLHTKDKKLILIPFNNVLKIEVEPFPDVYAKSMLHGAMLV